MSLKEGFYESTLQLYDDRGLSRAASSSGLRGLFRRQPADVSAALPAGAEEDIYRVVLTGSPAAPVSPERVQSALSGRCCALQVRDKTTARQELWDKCGEDTLRGLFLQELRRQYDAAPDDAVRRRIEQAARFGTAAMDDREV